MSPAVLMQLSGKMSNLVFFFILCSSKGRVQKHKKKGGGMSDDFPYVFSFFSSINLVPTLVSLSVRPSPLWCQHLSLYGTPETRVFYFFQGKNCPFRGPPPSMENSILFFLLKGTILNKSLKVPIYKKGVLFRLVHYMLGEA